MGLRRLSATLENEGPARRQLPVVIDGINRVYTTRNGPEEIMLKEPEGEGTRGFFLS
jgi:hypothetical protein